MGRPEKVLDPGQGPIAAFAHDLRKLRAAAGAPSYRQMSRTALFSPSVLSSAASGYRLPTLQVTCAFVEACGGNVEQWERRWRVLARDLVERGLAAGHQQAAGARPDRRPPSRSALEVVKPWRTTPAQLPPGPHAFVGRSSELARARGFTSISSQALPSTLLIGGQIGTGKSALALHLARELAPDFADGQLYADLVADRHVEVSPYEVVTGFLRALAIPPHRMPGGLEDRTGLFRSLLAQRSMVVLLDNARAERQVRPLLTSTGSSRVLVTGCGRLPGLDGVRRLELDVMPREDSLALLRTWVGDDRLDADREAAERIAGLCGDLPLALSIVGKRIAGTGSWPLDYVAQRLAEPGRLLDRLSVGDVSLRGRLTATYESLPSQARVVLHRLSRQSGCCATAEELAPSVGTPPDAVADTLDVLYNVGLVRHGAVPGRYCVSYLVRLFAREQLGEPTTVTLPDGPAISTSPLSRR